MSKLLRKVVLVLFGLTIIGEASAFGAIIGALAAGTAIHAATKGRVRTTAGININGRGDITSAMMTAGSQWDSRRCFRMDIPVNGYGRTGSSRPYYGEGSFQEAMQYAERARQTFTVLHNPSDWEYSVQMLHNIEWHRARNEENGHELLQRAGHKSTISNYDTPYASFSYFTPESSEAAIAMKSFVFEETILEWKFGIEWFNGKEYHRAWTTDGSDEMLVPAGQVWHIEAGDNRPDRARRSRFTRPERRERESSPPPMDTTLRRLGRGANEIYNQSVQYMMGMIPDYVKNNYSICVEYVNRYTPDRVKWCINTTLDALAGALDTLDKGAEITAAGVRRFLRDDLGVDAGIAQDVGDIVHAGSQFTISLLPGRAANFVSKLPTLEVVRLAPSGTRGSTYRFAFKDNSSSMRTINPRIFNTPQTQEAFVKRMIETNRWEYNGRKIGGRTAYYDPRKNLYYTKDTRHYDIEVWKVKGKWAYHKGSIECERGILYKEPNHPRETFI